MVGVRGPEVKYAAAGQSSQSLQVELLPRNNECCERRCLSCKTPLCISEVLHKLLFLSRRTSCPVKGLLGEQVMQRRLSGLAHISNVARSVNICIYINEEPITMRKIQCQKKNNSASLIRQKKQTLCRRETVHLALCFQLPAEKERHQWMQREGVVSKGGWRELCPETS